MFCKYKHKRTYDLRVPSVLQPPCAYIYMSVCVYRIFDFLLSQTLQEIASLYNPLDRNKLYILELP